MKRLGVAIAVEMYKQKKGITWWLVIGGPLLIAAMMYLDMALRYEYLLERGREEGYGEWGVLLQELVYLWAFFCPIGITLIAVLVHYPEWTQHAWKHLLALPIKRTDVYVAKWIIIVLLTYIAITVLVAGVYAVGRLVGFSEPFAWQLFGPYVLYQLAGVLGMISLQHWFSSVLRNVMLPVGIGVGGSVGMLFFAQSSWTSYIPYTAVLYAIPFEGVENSVSLTIGLIGGPLLLAAGLWEFSRRDIL